MASAAEKSPDSPSPWLDVARAFAAWVVCFAHARSFFMVDYAQSNAGALGGVFYLVTGLHHQAVMVFFVLSGYFVGGALAREVKSGSVDARRYAIKRTARLWVVLIPALLLTLLWDSLGTTVAGPSGYSGAFGEILASGPREPVDLSLATFFGNTFFLQDIAVPVFGSNGPLWSLAYEGWYYLLAILAAQVVVGSTIARALCGTTLVVALMFLAIWQPAVLLLGCNWLFGVVIHQWRKTPRGISWRVGTLGLFGVTLIASRFGWPIGHDLLVGASFALVLSWLAAASMPIGGKVAFVCADFSYTLYLTHYPLLAFLFFAFAGGAQLAFNVASVSELVALLSLCLAYAWLVWWLFERNTAKVRGWLDASLPRPLHRPV